MAVAIAVRRPRNRRCGECAKDQCGEDGSLAETPVRLWTGAACGEGRRALRLRAMEALAQFQPGRFEAEGVLVLPKLLSPSAVAHLTFVTDWLYRQLDSLESPPADLGSAEASRYIQRTYREWNGLQLDSVRDFLFSQAPHMSRHLETALAEITATVHQLIGGEWQWHPA